MSHPFIEGASDSDNIAQGLPGDLQIAPYTSQLRHDHAARTFYDSLTGDVIIVPEGAHDYTYSDAAQRAGLSVGKVELVDGAPVGVRYPEHEGILPFVSILNASSQGETWGEDLTEVVRMIGAALVSSRKQLAVLPAVHSVDAVAVARSSGVAEFLPPFTVSDALSPVAVLKVLKANTVQMADQRKRAILAACFDIVCDEIEGAQS